MRLLLLLLNIAIVHSIEVKLAGKVSFKGNYIRGTFTTAGKELQAFTAENQRAFEITDEALRSAIETLHGKKPDGIYLTKEWPWGNLYEKYGWSPVEVKIEGSQLTLTHVSTENVVLTRRIYENPYSTMEKKNILESATTRNIVTSLWDMKGKNISADDLDVVLDFKNEFGDEIARFNQDFPFGSRKRLSAKTTRFQGSFVDFAPGQKVLAQLEAKKATLKFKIPYEVTISGLVAVHYNEKYQDHYFYGLPIDRLLVAAGKLPVITVDQWLTYEFYYGVELNIMSADGNTVLQSVAADATTSGRRKASVATDAAKNGKKITSHPEKMPFEVSEEELKAIELEVPDQQLDEESEESTERTAEEPTTQKQTTHKQNTEKQTTEETTTQKQTTEVPTTQKQSVEEQATEQNTTEGGVKPSSEVPKTE